MSDEKEAPPKKEAPLDISYFLDEHGILMADKLKEYEASRDAKNNEKPK
ncbi:MAG: hypothetical protein IJM42_08150 [Synergistes sp.]|nr:hypothetical protein [Clostridia bacterium]MBQ9882563.1 hypothetical protein [Synergistes sp.]